MEKTILSAMLIAIGLFLITMLVRLILGPRLTDRILSVNAMTTLITGGICLLSLYLKADYLVDVALIYALLGFVVNTLLTRSLTKRRKKKEEKK